MITEGLVKDYRKTGLHVKIGAFPQDVMVIIREKDKKKKKKIKSMHTSF